MIELGWYEVEEKGGATRNVFIFRTEVCPGGGMNFLRLCGDGELRTGVVGEGYWRRMVKLTPDQVAAQELPL
jgi:hypothetical protein